MGNKVEELTAGMLDNYFQYLQRMTASIARSTKGLIAILLGDSETVLDVGCGSGVLMEAITTVNPNIKITGLDINQAAVDECHEKGLEAIHMGLHEYAQTGNKYDCLIFSSVLHEFSAYADDEKKAFTEEPIIEALEDAKKLLNPGGMIIIRDGVRAGDEWKKRNIRIQFKNPEDAKLIERFKKDFADYRRVVPVEGVLTAEDAKEFLYTFTWGEDSWARETLERFGILTKERWEELVENAGFFVCTKSYHTEEYLKYVGKKVVLTDEIKRLMKESTMILVGKLE